jgi:uncharacterized membrane protein YeaQ/YmgE (transglycosylase-associated protein family)
VLNFPDLAHASAAILQHMFAFFSNRVGCLGSLFVSLIGTVILLLLLRGCNAH